MGNTEVQMVIEEIRGGGELVAFILILWFMLEFFLIRYLSSSLYFCIEVVK